MEIDKLAGRTEHVRINGMLKPENLARLEAESGTMPEKLNRCLDRLREFEKPNRHAP